MVALYKASCPCGFEQENLRQGDRPDVEYFRFDIHLCSECNKLFDCWDCYCDISPPVQTFCPECEEEPLVSYTYNDDFDKIKHLCPHCHQETMSFITNGEWVEK